MKPKIEVHYKENGQYVVIGIAEHLRRLTTDESYAKRFFYVQDNVIFELSEHDYYDLKKFDTHIRHEEEKKINGKVVFFDALFIEGADYLPAEENTEEMVLRAELYADLRAAITQLAKEEQDFIHSIFWVCKSEREYARMKGLPQKTVNNQKKKILAKLKKIMGF